MVELNPQSGVAVPTSSTSGSRPTVGLCDTASAGCLPLSSAQVLSTQHECFVVLLVSEYVFEEVLFCFVFSVMRVLGIPSRVVTVFNAGHDGNANTQIEEVYSTTGEKLNLSKDSIWSGSPPHPLLLTSFYFSLIEIWNVCIWPVYLFLFFLYIVNDVVRIR